MQYPWWIPLLLTYFTTGQAQSNSESLSPTPSPSDDPQLATLVDVVQLPVIVNGTEVSNTTASAAASVGSSEAATTTEESASSASQESAAPTTYSTTAEETPSSSTASSSTPSSIPSEVVDTPPAVDAPPDLPPPSPSAELPPTPEFLSFNEWREKYVVLPDPSTRRAAKRAGQLARQDTQGGGAGAGGGAFDGDGADLGSLFSSEEGQEVVGVRDSARFGAGDSAEGRDGASVAAREGFGRSAQAHELETVDPHAGKPPSNSSPIQPLPNVGTGDPSDPLPHLKDRSNYAAFECAAMVHRSSRQSKGASSILVEKKDRYMLTPCSAEPKFVEVELCDEIQIDNIVLANFELFSSMFKHFEMTCSVDYPGRPDTWHNLGQFRARNARGIQVFRPHPIPNFCRYVRINFLSHYGSEFYCPVSLLRVYGYTQLDAYRESERKAKEEEARAAAAALEAEEEDDDDEELQRLLEADTQRGEKEKRDKWEADGRKEDRNSTEALQQPDAEAPTTTSETPTPTPSSPPPAESTQGPVEPTPASPVSSEAPISPTPTSAEPTHSSTGSEAVETGTVTGSSETAPSLSSTLEASSTTGGSSDPSDSSLISTAPSSAGATASSDTTVSSSEPSPAPSADSATSPTKHATSTTTSDTLSSSPSSSAAESASSISAGGEVSATPSAAPSPTSASTSTASTTTTTHPRATPSSDPSPAVIPTRPLPRNDTHLPRPPIAPPPSREPQPGESIYGTIMKRLASLEHNQTLSMHYIEAQSGMLREAFGLIERRLGEVEGTRTKQEQVFRQSLLDLDKQKNELERERLALISQVNLLAQEVRLEKRLSIAQLIGLLAIVLFVGFTRGSPTSPFLHLASAQAMRAAAKEESKRKEAARREGDLPESASEGPRRDPAYRSNSLTIARLPSKRLSSSLAPKPAPRRHYGNGNSGASSSKAPLRSPRTWTPPPRHASAPPEDPFASSLTSALESGGGTARRRSSKQPKYSHSPAPATNGRGGESVVGLAIHTSSGSSPYLNTPTIPPRASSSNSHRHAFRPSYVTRPSTLDDADTEPSEVGGDPEEYSASDVPSRGAFGRLGRNGLPSGDTDGGYRTYSASEEEEEDESRPPSPPPGRRDGASPFLKPPRPAVKKRPLSSPGPWGREERIPFPRQSDAPSQQQQQQQRLPTPEANLPSPPPEPEPQLQRDRQGEEEKGKGKEHAL